MSIFKQSLIFLGFICLLLPFQNCGPARQASSEVSGSSSPLPNSSDYFKTVPNITLEVYYEPGAEPFVGNTGSGRPIWGILKDNLTAIFQYRTSPPIINAPMDLAQMSAIPAQNKTSWLGTEILALNSNYKNLDPSLNDGRFYIYFLNGYYDNGSGPQTSVIGVSLTGTPIIAIFKQVVRASAANPSGLVAKFVEQSTLVHEMGHALGFVNNGVPMATNHQDTAHGSHSTDPNCVMYWQNEGSADLVQFIQKYLATSNFVMWGPNVLQDARGFSQ